MNNEITLGKLHYSIFVDGHGDRGYRTTTPRAMRLHPDDVEGYIEALHADRRRVTNPLTWCEIPVEADPSVPVGEIELVMRLPLIGK